MPLYKKGDPLDSSNYRPISLTSTFSKIFEKMIANKLIPYLEEHDILCDNQFGYRKSLSSADAIIFTLEKILDALENQHSTVGVFLDLSKAFDNVEHRILIAILEKIGLSDNMLRLIHSFLSNRSQYVFLTIEDKEYKSSFRTPTCSVPQGSILGPLFFLIYVNFIPQMNNMEEVTMFCDDTTIISHAPSSLENEIELHNLFNGYAQTLKSFNLMVNASKTKFVNFRRSSRKDNRDLSVFLGDAIVEQVEMVKFLGVHIDEDLTYNAHVDILLSKLSSSLFVLRRLRYICHLEARLIAFHAIFQSHVGYCLLIWGATSAENLKAVFVMQKKALRLVLHLKRNASCKTLFTAHGIFTVYAQYVYQLLVYIKVNQGIFQTANSTHTYSTRHGNFLKPTSLTADSLLISKRFVKNYGVQLFNKLPRAFVNLDLSKFKKALKKHLLDLEPYSINDITNSLKNFNVTD